MPRRQYTIEDYRRAMREIRLRPVREAAEAERARRFLALVNEQMAAFRAASWYYTGVYAASMSGSCSASRAGSGSGSGSGSDMSARSFAGFPDPPTLEPDKTAMLDVKIDADDPLSKDDAAVLPDHQAAAHRRPDR